MKHCWLRRMTHDRHKIMSGILGPDAQEGYVVICRRCDRILKIQPPLISEYRA